MTQSSGVSFALSLLLVCLARFGTGACLFDGWHNDNIVYQPKSVNSRQHDVMVNLVQCMVLLHIVFIVDLVSQLVVVAVFFACGI